MAYFVTGATGFIGRFLVAELLARPDAEVFVLCRESSLDRLEILAQRWPGRVTPVVGDLRSPALGVDEAWIDAQQDRIEHFFHLAAIYDMTADAALNDELNIAGTERALELAARLGAGTFHHVSSVAVAGEHRGEFTEAMFDEGQHLPSPYHRTKFESERLVREQDQVPWRVYRPAIVVGHSETGEMDKVDGPYYFFGVLKRLRDAFPNWLPLIGLELGDTNVVPVDYVAKAIDRLAHVADPGTDTFHLVNPEPQPVVQMVNAFCRAAGAPRFATPLDRISALARPRGLLAQALRADPVQAVLGRASKRVGIPAEVLAHTSFVPTFASRRTEKALAGSGIAVPELDSYAAALWHYWEGHLDGGTARDPQARKALAGRHVVITGASSGIGRVTALKVAQAGGIPVLVARGRESLEEVRVSIELAGGQAHVYPCDLADLDAIDELCTALRNDLPSVDYVVNNAGRSIRRSIRLSLERFHDFERTMQLNYFGAIRLVMGLLPMMREQRRAHVVNVSSIGVQTNPPRFSAYVASKAALDAWSNVVSSELVGDGITFTNVHMPLVRTPMIAPTTIYRKFPTISPAQAADQVITALVERPHELNTMLGNAGAVAHTVAPRASFRVLNLAYQVFPDSAAAGGGRESEQVMLARLFRGVHW